MNTKNLTYVITVAEERSFSNAAKRLYLSQPSLSQSISSIEKELGTLIFDRSTIPLSLTYAGEKYIKAAAQILSLEQNLKLEIQDILDDRRGRLIIGISPLRSANIIPYIFPIFRKEFPNIELILLEGTNSKLTDMVLKGKVDLALATPFDTPEMESVPLLNDEVLLAAYKNHPIAQKLNIENDFPKIDLNSFKNEPFILLSPENDVRLITDKIFSDYNIIPRVILETTSLSLAHHLVTQGMAITFILASMINLYIPEQQGCYLRFSIGNYSHNLRICYRKDHYLSKIMLNFIRMAQIGIEHNV